MPFTASGQREPLIQSRSAGAKTSDHFQGLDELRFLAAGSVLVHHIEQFKHMMSYPSLWGSLTLAYMGDEGVRLFFVLSGFLITYILLTELDRTSNCHLAKFYARRALRIWPLYFLTTIMGFFFLPLWLHSLPSMPRAIENLSDHLNNGFMEKLGLFLTFLPNLSLQLFPPILGIAQLWSLGVEEQYYLIYPLLLSLFRRMPAIGISSIVLVKFLGLYLLSLISSCFTEATGVAAAYSFLDSLDLESLALGGLAAYVLFKHRSGTYRFMSHPVSSLVVGAFSIALFMLSFPGHRWAATITFAALVVNYAVKPVSHNPLAGIIRSLGRISYGIYMYQGFVILLVMTMLRQHLPAETGLAFNTLVYVTVFAVVIGISTISYRYLEKPFLNLKSRLSIVHSHD